ncbi:MAG: RNA polymerase factor sigma-32 [Alphaproteobacteria bacterium]|nr:RNA polymerase factor sigma-32 [Alphaproteobacteria bacterium]
MKAISANRQMVRAAMAAPYLEREQEHDLAVRWKDKKDQDALHQITMAHMRLVISMAAKFRNFGLPMNDLIQEGHVGLLEAAARFDPDRGVRFSTYATWWIRASMQDYVLRNWSIVRGGTSSTQKSLFFNLRRLKAKIANDPGVQYLDTEGRAKIANELGVSQQDVETMDMRLSSGDQSLNLQVGEDGDTELQALMPSDAPNPEDVVIGMKDRESRSRWLNEALAELSDREQRIIRERHLSLEPVTLDELGKVLGVSKERVRQLESRAMHKLRDSMATHVAAHDELFLEG